MSLTNVESNAEYNVNIFPKEVYSELYEHSCRYHASVDDKITSFKGPTNIALLGEIEKFVDEVKNSLEVGFIEIKSVTDSFSFMRCKRSTFASKFKLVNGFYDCIIEHSNYYIYSENVQLYKLACEEVGLSSIHLTSPEFYHSDLNLYEFEVFNQLIHSIRTKSHSTNYTDKVVNRKRELNKKFKSYSQYVNSLFKDRSRLLVVRIDLSYLVEHDEQNDRTRHLVTLEEVKDDLYRLLSNKRHNAMFDHLEGYIWKLEYGDLKGYHYHLLFFFKGSELKSDFHKGEQIGKYWRDVITKGRGYYFNCNRKKTNYTHLGIGMINADSAKDTHLRFNLTHYVLRYLIKSDQYLKLKLKKNDRSIGKGMVLKKKSNAGRPRAAANPSQTTVGSCANTFGLL
ncbi:inovirus-type Gp2 protein [Devosia sp.]|uniref:YagK/YfjJ domain-containing protein n=1 Tax=Devosia sp. TaxID=1871048 RepID=UPI00273518E9|nr:inovirus-type Gp2 protein [Devosia sp.]MDP2780063.1 inovirus-type Gp2 protein [Devosia sp.]